MTKILFSGFAILVVIATIFAMVQSTVPLIYFVLMILGLALIWRLAQELREREHIQNSTQTAYRLQNPSCCIGDRLSCNRCGGGKVIGLTSMAHPKYREHSCSDCGEPLFYSRK